MLTVGKASEKRAVSFSLEEGDSMFLRNVCTSPRGVTAQRKNIDTLRAVGSSILTTSDPLCLKYHDSRNLRLATDISAGTGEHGTVLASQVKFARSFFSGKLPSCHSNYATDRSLGNI